MFVLEVPEEQVTMVFGCNLDMTAVQLIPTTRVSRSKRTRRAFSVAGLLAGQVARRHSSRLHFSLPSRTAARPGDISIAMARASASQSQGKGRNT